MTNKELKQRQLEQSQAEHKERLKKQAQNAVDAGATYETLFSEEERENFLVVYRDVLGDNPPQKLVELLHYIHGQCININTRVALSTFINELHSWEVKMKVMTANQFYQFMKERLKPTARVAEKVFKDAELNEVFLQCMVEQMRKEVKGDEGQN